MNLWGIERSHTKGPTLDMSLVWLQCQHNMALWQFKKSRLLNSYPSSPFCDLFLALCLPCHWNLPKEGGQYNRLNICKVQWSQIANIVQIWFKALIVWYIMVLQRAGDNNHIWEGNRWIFCACNHYHGHGRRGVERQFTVWKMSKSSKLNFLSSFSPFQIQIHIQDFGFKPYPNM